MRLSILCAAGFVLLNAAAVFAAETPIAKVYQVDKARGIVVISGRIQEKLSTGDRVHVRTKSGPVGLDVFMPMMSVATCRVASGANAAAVEQLAAGLDVYAGGAPEAAAASAQSESGLAGRWMEFWAPGQATDVSYHDIYLVSADGGLRVRLEKDGGAMSDVMYADGWFTFTQKTSFDVKYRLKLSSDGLKLEGTAATPNKTVPIRWERQ